MALSAIPPPPSPPARLAGAQALPPYRYVPGLNPHPTRHPGGHSRGRPERKPIWPTTEAWAGSEDHRFAIDLFNEAYLWEAHEVWESLWHLAPKNSPEELALRALIQSAAALLKTHVGCDSARDRLLENALRGFEASTSHGRVRGGRCLGLDLIDFASRLESHLCRGGTYPFLMLSTSEFTV